LAEGLPSRQIILTGSPMTEVLGHYREPIAASTVLADLGLNPGAYFLVSAHREETVDDPVRLQLLVELLEALAMECGLPVLVSTHPRTRKRLLAYGRGETDGVVFHEPFGFFDYVHLQSHAHCVLSDSGTISEESSILGFPAVTLRDAIERPEAIESGSIVATGLDPGVVLPAVALATAQWAGGERPPVPTDYQITNCSQRVVNIIRSTAHVYHQWAGIRRRSWK
jgi:UDP-N-acetylglucosamine 2-epimerase